MVSSLAGSQHASYDNDDNLNDNFNDKNIDICCYDNDNLNNNNNESDYNETLETKGADIFSGWVAALAYLNLRL